MQQKLVIAWLVSLVLAVQALPGGAAEPQEGSGGPIGGLSFADEIEVTIVNVIAFVTDKQGNAVTDLTKEDFTITHDGQGKVITNFHLYTEEMYQRQEAAAPFEAATTTPAPPVAVEEAPPMPIHLAVYVDNENLDPLDRNRVLRAVKKFIRANLRPPAQVMVASFQMSFDVMQPFTDDPNAVIEALDELNSHSGGWPERVSKRNEIQDMMQQLIEEEGISRGYGAARGSREYIDTSQAVQAYADEEANRLAFTLGGLRDMISLMAGLPGRKSILYLSNGLPMVPGIELFTAFSETFQDEAPLTHIRRYDRTRWFTSLVGTANAQDISFYTIDAGGLQVTGLSTAEYSSPQDPLAASLSDHTSIDSLRFMADATGGLAVFRTNDFSGGLERIRGDLHTYYSIGYDLSSSGGDKIHQIKVTLPNHPDYNLRYRRRFVEKSLETRVQDRVMTGLFFDIDENPMEIRFEAGKPAPTSQNTYTLPVSISFPLEKIALIHEGEDYVGRVVLFIAARDRKGKKSDLVRRNHEVRLAASNYPEARSKRFRIDAALLMEPGSYRVAVGLLDEVVRQASYQTVHATVEAIR